MTRQELLQEFKRYPRSVQYEVLRELEEVYADNLIDKVRIEPKHLTIEQRRKIVKRLGRSIKMKHPPMTKKEVREAYYGHLAEKYK